MVLQTRKGPQRFVYMAAVVLCLAPLIGRYNSLQQQFTLWHDLSMTAGYLLYCGMLLAVAMWSIRSLDDARKLPMVGLPFVVTILLAVSLHVAALAWHLAALPGSELSKVTNQVLLLGHHAPVRTILFASIAVPVVWLLSNQRLRGFFRAPLSMACITAILAFLSALHLTATAWRDGDFGFLALIFAPLAAVSALLLQALFSQHWFREIVLPHSMPETLDAIDRNNRIFMWLLGAGTPIAASTSSIMLGSAMVWAIFYTLIGRLKFQISRANIPIIVSAVLLFLTMAIATLANSEVLKQDLFEVIKLAPFLSVFFVIPRLYRSPRSTSIPFLAQGAAFGLYVFAAIALYQYFSLIKLGPYTYRIEAFSGNPIPAAYAAAAACLFASLGLDNLPRSQLLFRSGAIVAGLIGIAFTAALSILLALPLLLLLVAWRYRGTGLPTSLFQTPEKGRPRRLALLAGLALALLAITSPLLPRVAGYVSAAVESSASGESESFNDRMALLSAGWTAFKAAPMSGYGVQNRFRAIVPYLPVSDTKAGDKEHARVYSHTHNGFLTLAVAGGIPGLIAGILFLLAPWVVVWRSGLPPWRNDLSLLALGGLTIYVCGSMGGIMFFHDAIDAIYCWIAIVVGAHFRPPATSNLHPG